MNAEWLYMIGAVIAVLIVAFAAGRARLMISLVALYIAWGAASVFPLKSVDYDQNTTRLFIFGIAFFAALLALNRSFLRRRLSMKDSATIAVLVGALAFCGLLATMLMIFLPAQLTAHVPELLHTIFEKPAAQFGWFLLPVVVILLAKGSPERRSVNPS